MKKSTILFISITAVILSLLLYFALRPSDVNAGVHEEHEESHTKVNDATSSVKEVALNEAQYTAAAIELGTFTMKNLSDVVNANGYTKLPPQNQADISVHLSGVVQTIKVIEGQYVKKGQVLGTVESPEFARIQEAYQTSKSNLEFLTLDFERQRILSEENVNSKKVFQRTKSDLEIEKARYNSLQKQLRILNLGTTNTSAATMPIISPIAGYVTSVNVKIGSNAEVGKPLFTVVDNSKLHVDLLVYEKDLQKVKAGQNIRFVLTNQDNLEINGRVFNVSKSFENDTKSVAVHADIFNGGQALIPGMYVNALIDTGTKNVQAVPATAVVKADGREFIFVLEEHEGENDADESHGHEEHNHEGHSHNETEDTKEEASHHFKRIEVKTGTAQLGYVQVSILQNIEKDARIVLKGAYYLQSHLIKSEGGGGHQH